MSWLKLLGLQRWDSAAVACRQVATLMLARLTGLKQVGFVMTYCC